MWVNMGRNQITEEKKEFIKKNIKNDNSLFVKL